MKQILVGLLAIMTLSVFAEVELLKVKKDSEVKVTFNLSNVPEGREFFDIYYQDGCGTLHEEFILSNDSKSYSYVLDNRDCTDPLIAFGVKVTSTMHELNSFIEVNVAVDGEQIKTVDSRKIFRSNPSVYWLEDRYILSLDKE